MKSILIAATTVGAAIAGIILYFRKTRTKELGTGRNGFQAIDATIAGTQGNMTHTMG